jgi:hypothetical protein
LSGPYTIGSGVEVIVAVETGISVAAGVGIKVTVEVGATGVDDAGMSEAIGLASGVLTPHALRSRAINKQGIMQLFMGFSV